MVQSSPLGKRSSKPKIIYDPSDNQAKTKSRTKVSKKKSSQAKPSQGSTNPQNGPKGPSNSVIQSKIQATNRQEKVTLVSTGGGTVVSFNAGSYEILKRVLSDAFTQATGLTLEGRYIQSHSTKETPHQFTSSIQVSSQDITTFDVASYTINFYHSKCKIMVNGKDEGQFQSDLKLVLNNISRKQEYGTLPSDECMNDAIKCILEAELQTTEEGTSHLSQERSQERSDRSDNSGGKVKNATISRAHPVSTEAPITSSLVCAPPSLSSGDVAEQSATFQSHIPSHVDDVTKRLELISLDHNIQQLCKFCKRPAKTRCIMCQICNKMMHLKCDKITVKSIQDEILNRGTYRCKLCSPGAVAIATSTLPSNPVLNDVNAIDTLADSQVTAVGHPDRQDNTSSAPIITFPDEEEGEEETEQAVTYHDSRDNTRDTTPAGHEDAGSSTASGGHQTPDSGQGVNDLEERLKSCQSMEQDIRKRERQLQNREDKLKVREKTIQDRQEDLAKAQAYIVKLEGKIKDLESSLKIARMAQPQPSAPTVPPPPPHNPYQTQPNFDPYEFTRQTCTTLEYKLKAEMNEKMYNMLMREPPRVHTQPPVTVIPMMFPMVHPYQQVYAPPRRRGPNRPVVPPGAPVSTGRPPVIPMPGPPPQTPSTSAPVAPNMVPPVISRPSPIPQVPVSPVISRPSPIPQVPVSPVPVVTPVSSTPLCAPVSIGPIPQPIVSPISLPGSTTASTTFTTMTQVPVMAYTAPLGVPTSSQQPLSTQAPLPVQSPFLNRPGLSHHPKWMPTM